MRGAGRCGYIWERRRAKDDHNFLEAFFFLVGTEEKWSNTRRFILEKGAPWPPGGATAAADVNRCEPVLVTPPPGIHQAVVKAHRP